MDDLPSLEERVDDLTMLGPRIEELEDQVNRIEEDRDKLLNEVKDIMTVFENRVLKEIENLTDARIEPIDKVTGGLMLSVADLTATISALIELYGEEHPDSDAKRFLELTKQYKEEMLKTMKEASGFSESKSSEEDSTSTSDG